MTQVAAARTRVSGNGPVRADAAYVLYWMTAARRLGWNHALDRAAAWAVELSRPLLIFEAMDAGYPWASDRLHRFVLDGMADNAASAARAGVAYYPYVEPAAGAGRGLLQALAGDAAVVVADDYPAFVVPARTRAAAARAPVRFEEVDGNGLVPMRLAGQAFTTASAFRRFAQRVLPGVIHEVPSDDPLRGLSALGLAAVSPGVLARWPAASAGILSGSTPLSTLPIDHQVVPVPVRGGPQAAAATLAAFVERRLPEYGHARRAADATATSGLSPYLHFGHIGACQVVHAVLSRDGWLGDLPRRATGAREGWWGVSAQVEAFLDQIVVWRELGFNTAVELRGYDRYESLPAWAQASLDPHAADARSHLYTLEEFGGARTHDPLWNAAQIQLLREGRIHNYLRMLWGKKILEWTRGPREALDVMVALNNRYALDGRDPNSYSGIFWTLGRYDRPWAPERPVFGRVRYMSSANTARKMDLRGYLSRFGALDPGVRPGSDSGQTRVRVGSDWCQS